MAVQESLTPNASTESDHNSVGVAPQACATEDLRWLGTPVGLAGVFERFLTSFEIVGDFLVVLGAIELTYFLAIAKRGGRHDTIEVAAVACALAGVFVLLLGQEGAYRKDNSLLQIKETERLIRVGTEVFLVLLLATRLVRIPLATGALAVAVALTCLGLTLQRHAIHLLLRAWHKKGIRVRKVVIFGAGYTGRRVFGALARSAKLGLEPVAVVDEDPVKAGERFFEPSYTRQRSVQVKHGPITKKLVLEHNASVVVIAIPSLPREKFLQVFSESTAAGAAVAFVPNHHVPSELSMEYANIDGLLLTCVGSPPDRPIYRLLKRLLDLVLGSVAFVILFPLLLLVSLLIRLESDGSAVFVQNRAGKGGRLFRCYKFRTMYTTAGAYERSPEAAEDPRITKLGRYLRRSSLDELPQLVNVIKGEMSLVGPRPEMPFIVEQYTLQQRQRLLVKPGITGLWQISADRSLPIHENIEYDLYYIQNRNFFMDLAILLHTLFFAMRGI